MALGSARNDQRFKNPKELLGDRLKGIYRLLADHGEARFPHGYFAGCYKVSAVQDTVTHLRSAIRKLLRALDRDRPVATRFRAALRRDDDYAGAGKPPCDWDDGEARVALVDALVRDALAALAALEGEALSRPAAEAAELLALVAGQDVAEGDDGCSASFVGWSPTDHLHRGPPRPATDTRRT